MKQKKYKTIKINSMDYTGDLTTIINELQKARSEMIAWGCTNPTFDANPSSGYEGCADIDPEVDGWRLETDDEETLRELCDVRQKELDKANVEWVERKKLQELKEKYENSV